LNVGILQSGKREAHGRITRRETMELCSLSEDQASHLLRRLVREGKLEPQGKSRSATFYVLART
jgi:predicted HTH transcriptional regulator